VDGVVICQLDISPSNAPIVIKGKDKNGQTIEKLYVRNGNASQEMPVSELHHYMKERFA
jgi:hypothetical protein